MGECLKLDSRYRYYISLLYMIYSCALGSVISPIQLHSISKNDTKNSATLVSYVNTINPAVIGGTETVFAVEMQNMTTLDPFTDSKTPRQTNSVINMDETQIQVSPNRRSVNKRRGVAANPPDELDDDITYIEESVDEYDAIIRNKSAKGKYIGSPCNEMRCDPALLRVTCDDASLKCVCERNYPVHLGLTKGCAKPKKLGEQCFYDETCIYNDENSLCVQVHHNALCQCTSGYHSVSYMKPTKRVFCTQDLKELTSDLPTLLGVSTGIAILAGLICLVLHLFSKTKYPRHRHFGDANLPPPVMYSSDSGEPSASILHELHSGRRSSRSSVRSSASMGSYGNRRSSGDGPGHFSGGSKGILVSTSRTGSRRPSIASIHSTSSSVRSYSMMRFEKEIQQREIRQEMKLRLTRLQQQHSSQTNPQIMFGDPLLLHTSALSRLVALSASSSNANANKSSALSESLSTLKETGEFSNDAEIVLPKIVKEDDEKAVWSMQL